MVPRVADSGRRVSTGPAVILIACAVLGARPAAGQESPPPASQPVEATLDLPYVDGSFGFSVQPPAGCTLFREKQIADADVEIARFVDLVTRHWSFAVRLSSTTQELDAQTIISGITARLTAQNEDVHLLRGEPARVAGRDGVRYAASFKAEGVEWLRQQAVTPMQPKEYFALVFITPLSDRAVAEPLFEKMVASFKILRNQNDRERIDKALERGQGLLTRAARGDLNITERVFADIYYLWRMEGRDIGFVRVSERAATIDHREGLQVREWGWVFDSSGAITHLQHDMFLAGDLSFERWENRLYAIPPAAGNAPRKAVLDFDNAVRQDRQLMVAYTPLPGAPEMREKAMDVPKTYASAAWNVLFPRMVDLAEPELYAFSTYKSERRGQVLRTIEVLGPVPVIIDGQQVPAVKLEDSEGLIPPKSEIYVGRDGKILRVVADKLEMVASNQEAIDRTFGKKVAEGQNLLKQLHPEPPRRPGGAPRLPPTPAPTPKPPSALPQGR